MAEMGEPEVAQTPTKRESTVIIARVKFDGRPFNSRIQGVPGKLRQEYRNGDGEIVDKVEIEL